MNKTRWIVFSVICVLVLGVLVVTKKDNDINIDNIDAGKVVSANKTDRKIGDHVFGSDQKKVILIEYGDFQCPGCASLFPKLKPLKEQYKDQLTFVFRNFPLTSIHPNALAAATAAEAAGLQGKWWEYHDMLYENQNEWSSVDSDKRTSIFVGYARDLELNIKTFEKDLSNEAISQKISRDQALGTKIGATSTPTLVLNGKKLAQSEWSNSEKLETTIRKAIEESGQTLTE